jgi:hypothetical protein
MSDAKPVESKIEAAAKVVDTAVALTSAPTAPIAAAKVGWWAMKHRKRFAFIAAGAAIGAGGAIYAAKHFTADPGKAAAQTEPPAVVQAKPEEPAKPAAPPAPELNLDVPPIKVPTFDVREPKPAPMPALDLTLPDIAPPPAPSRPNADIVAPGPSKADITGPVITIPTKPEGTETKPPTPGDDLFKAPGELPTTVKDRKDKKDDAPVIRIGGIDPPPPPTPPKNSDPPPIPNIDIQIPVAPMPASSKKDDPPKISDIDIKIPDGPAPMPTKNDDPPKVTIPAIGPAPKTADPPVIAPPKSDKLPDVPPVIEPPAPKSPMIPDIAPPPLPASPMPTIRVPNIGDPPPPPLTSVKPDKKDSYDEDWHTRVEDSYAEISRVYYKTTDYAAALEAYNKDRRKPGERIIRVPPPWVLEEQFPNLVGAKAEKPEAKTTSNPKFEPAAPTPSSERSAPPAPAGNNEYRVKNDAGETIREIARKIYGDANAWQKLWKLNPDLDPTLPIPSGTTLRLEK